MIKRNELSAYFYNRFPSQLGKLDFRPANDIIKKIYDDSNLCCFGYNNWEAYDKDIIQVPVEDRSMFTFALYMVTLTDQSIYTYFNEDYSTWQKKTYFPKFGRSGLGLHNNYPYIILDSAARNGNGIAPNTFLHELPEYVIFMFETVVQYFGVNLPDVSPLAFFEKIHEDKTYNSSTTAISNKFREEFELNFKKL